jgi:AhpD family alkylhydroperoxidase
MRITVSPDDVKAAFAEVSDDPSFAESRELVDRGRMPVEMLQAMSLQPGILKAFATFGDAAYPGGILERSLKELVILESSRQNACQFCTNSHISIMRHLGIASDPVAHLENPDGLSEREQLALAYTRAAMADSNRVPDSLFAELKAHFTESEIVELTFLIGMINMLNLFNNCLHVTYHGDYESS